MRLLETMESRITAVIGLFLALLAVSLSAFVLITAERYAAEHARLAITAINGFLEESLITLMQTSPDDGKLDAFLARANLVDGIEKVRVIHSPRLSEQYGVKSDRLPADDLERSVLESGIPTTKVEQMHGRHILTQVIPVRARQECLTCHRGQGGDILGAVRISASVDEAYASAVNHTFKLFLITLGVVTAMACGLLLVWRHSVFIPLQSLSRFAKTLANGELGYRAALNGPREISQLAQSLNTMAANLQAREEALEESQRALDLSNKQLSNLIQEMHHRIKNNLQSIASLLELEMLERCPSSVARDCLQKSVNRIKSIAAVHQLLSVHCTSLTNIKDLARTLAAITTRSLVEPGKEVNFSIQGPDIYLGSQKATALALVLNELLSNAVKHGFVRRPRGSIEITFSADTRGITVVVKDDGVGLPPDFKMEASANLGLQIASNLAQSDLGGSLSLYSDHGTKAVIFFPD